MHVKLVAAGERFGRLVAIATQANRRTQRVLCRCDCGRVRSVRFYDLRCGSSRSCGCARGDSISTHGQTRGGRFSPTYHSWAAMHTRCGGNPNRKSFPNYAGRGVSICDRWASFEAFFADMGERPPGKSIDRIDPYGNYEPGNCRWATPSEQRRNQRQPEKANG